MILLTSISARMLLFIAVLLALDVYSFIGIKSVFKKSSFLKLYYFLFFSALIISYLGFLNMVLYFRETINSTSISNLLRGFFFSFFIFKILFVIFLILNDIERILNFSFHFITKLLFDKKKVVETKSRRKFISQFGLFIAAIPFSSLLYGITLGKYNFKVIKHHLKFDNLPESFNKFKIVHISDIHAGSFDSIECVQEGVNLIQEQNPDIILFSGDLVNNDSREIEPYISMFKSLKAPFGKYAVLGNHDYGDYKTWNSKQEKEENLNSLLHYFELMDFKLLFNESKTLTINNQHINIIGVENWGRPPFPQKGDLNLALKNTTDSFNILLSHDPTHWDSIVKNHQTKIDLTLSGHTHGMQFGVEIPGIKWSPVKYFYPHWAGLYHYKDKYLNVNRGFGFIGYPGRVGIWPEITVIELNN
ncbi:MAG: metallophosphoesterase [Flavobacteriaceae bacterium]|nr:metallophosphoesterase [Flavobacteriaceae bacterium]